MENKNLLEALLIAIWWEWITTYLHVSYKE